MKFLCGQVADKGDTMGNLVATEDNFSKKLQNIYTMKNRIYILLFALVTIFTACTPTTAPIYLHWEFGQNDVEPGICEAYLTLTNTSEQELTHEGWTLYFNLMSLHPIYTEGDALRETEIQASWHSIEPTQTFAPLAPGESQTLPYDTKVAPSVKTSAPKVSS